MIGTTLRQIRRFIDAAAVDEGRYYVVCSRTGEQPTPVAGKRFVSRSAARSALGAAEQYRETLRSYDPGLAHHDLIVCEGNGSESPSSEADAGAGSEVPSDGASALGPAGGRLRIDYCHDVAAALFEALVPRGDDGVEGAILDAYVERAEEVADPDELCLRLLETAAGEIDRRLSPAEQRSLLADAAARLSPTARNQGPIERTLARLASTGIVGEYSVGRSTGATGPSCSLTLGDYALRPGEGEVATLPVAIGLRRRYPVAISIPRAVERGDRTWQLDIELTYDGASEDAGLCRTPVRTG